MNGVLKLIRFEHGVLYGIGVFVGAFLGGGADFFLALLGFFVAFFLQGAFFAMNDYFDYEIDKKNKRYDRPLVTGEVKRETAFFVFVFFLVVGGGISVFLSRFAGVEILILVCVIIFFSILYNLWLKKYPIIGNAFIAITMAIPFVFGGLIAKNVNEKITTISAIAFLFGLGREIMKDVEDYSAEKKFHFKTLPIIIGKKKSIYSVVLLYLAGIAFSIYPIFTFFSNKVFYYFIIIPDLIFVYVCLSALRNQSLSNLRKMRKITLIGISIGLLIFLLSSL